MAKGIALTGGIGSGKSTVASIFSRLGIAVIDTDRISHELTSKDGPAIKAIKEAFGDAYVREGSLDRMKMRKLVFSEESSRKRLESILHPMIRDEVKRRIGLVSSPYFVVVVPLFFETNQYGHIVDRVLVVDCSEAQQVERAMKRSSLSEAEVLAIMEKQVGRSERIEGADDVVENGGTMEMLEAEVLKLHNKYLALINPC